MSRKIKRRSEPPVNRTAWWTIVPVSLQSTTANALNAAVKRCREAGLYRMTRSRLVRIALLRLDIDAVIREEAGHRV